jgi:hypothetical protein
VRHSGVKVRVGVRVRVGLGYCRPELGGPQKNVLHRDSRTDWLGFLSEPQDWQHEHRLMALNLALGLNRGILYSVQEGGSLAPCFCPSLSSYTLELAAAALISSSTAMLFPHVCFNIWNAVNFPSALAHLMPLFKASTTSSYASAWGDDLRISFERI